MLFWLTSLLSAALVLADHAPAAGWVALAGWQLAYVLDCLDGAIARTFDKMSRAGVGVDASADVTAMGSIVGVSVLAAATSEADPLVLALLGVSGVARAAGPLWTVVDKMNATPEAPTTASTATSPRAWMPVARSVYSVFRAAVDYPVTLALIAGCVFLASPDAWAVLSWWLAATGMALAALAFVLAGRADDFS